MYVALFDNQFQCFKFKGFVLNWERGIVKKAAEVNGRHGVDSRKKR